MIYFFIFYVFMGISVFFFVCGENKKRSLTAASIVGMLWPVLFITRLILNKLFK